MNHRIGLLCLLLASTASTKPKAKLEYDVCYASSAGHVYTAAVADTAQEGLVIAAYLNRAHAHSNALHFVTVAPRAETSDK